MKLVKKSERLVFCNADYLVRDLASRIGTWSVIFRN